MYTATSGFGTKHDFGSFSAAGFGGSENDTVTALKRGTPNTETTSSPAPRKNIDKDAGDTVVVDIEGSYPLTIPADALATTMPVLYGKAGVDALDQPEESARYNAEFLEDYSVTITPGTGFSWSKISWPQFKGLKCTGTTVAFADQVDVCEMLEDEVALMDDGTASVIAVINNGDRADLEVRPTADEFKLNGFDLKLPIAQTRWTTLQYYNTRTTNKEDMQDAYDGTKAAAADTAIRVNTPGRINAGPLAADGRG